ncbi:unnamed protein product, partial [Strongylus vulgaris]
MSLTGTLEERKLRLQHFAELYFEEATSAEQNNTQQSIALQCAQLARIEAGLGINKSTRAKRQIHNLNTLWSENHVYYYFATGVEEHRKTSIRNTLQYIRDHTCIDFTESDTAVNRIRVFRGSGCYSYIGMVGGV